MSFEKYYIYMDIMVELSETGNGCVIITNGKTEDVAKPKRKTIWKRTK